MMKLYAETGENGKAKTMTDTLLGKPVKIPSTAIREIREEAEKIRTKNAE
jgi:hypothetical protein